MEAPGVGELFVQNFEFDVICEISGVLSWVGHQWDSIAGWEFSLSLQLRFGQGLNFLD